jgi:hypothetical protein
MKPAPTHALQLPFGFIVWSVWFVAMYGGLSVGCALAPPPPAAGALTWLNGALAALTVLTCGWLLGCARRCWRAATLGAAAGETQGRFVPMVGAGLHLAAAVATAFVGLPLAGLPPCV